MDRPTDVSSDGCDPAYVRASGHGYGARVGRCGKDVYCSGSLGLDDVCDDENRAGSPGRRSPERLRYRIRALQVRPLEGLLPIVSRDPTMESDEAPRDLAARAISLRVSLRQTPHVQGEA
jgi:hypothetical protein